jgi:hypothetical protein
LHAAATLGALMACISATSLSVSPSQYYLSNIVARMKSIAPRFRKETARRSQEGANPVFNTERTKSFTSLN